MEQNDFQEKALPINIVITVTTIAWLIIDLSFESIIMFASSTFGLVYFISNKRNNSRAKHNQVSSERKYESQSTDSSNKNELIENSWIVRTFYYFPNTISLIIVFIVGLIWVHKSSLLDKYEFQFFIQYSIYILSGLIFSLLCFSLIASLSLINYLTYANETEKKRNKILYWIYLIISYFIAVFVFIFYFKDQLHYSYFEFFVGLVFATQFIILLSISVVIFIIVILACCIAYAWEMLSNVWAWVTGEGGTWIVILCFYGAIFYGIYRLIVWIF